MWLDHSAGLLTANTILDGSGYTPFLTYCRGLQEYDIKILSFLVNRGANLDTRDCFGNSCLHIILATRTCIVRGSTEESKSYLSSARAAMV